MIERMNDMNGKKTKARVLAYYLPQFHPIPENDEWWGKGFTEWTNVGKAKPLFPGHYQPHVPADLGYYDLRVPETREAQAQMAREAGVEGFVYWHYWFGNGKRLLERPFNEVLASGKPDFPFALAWANETWSGSCHGLIEGKTLIEQTYPGDDDYIAHFNALLPAFKDKRYITCDGKPIFMIYQPTQLPELAHFVTIWQDLAHKSGLKGIYFIAIGQKWSFDYDDMISKGMDAINLIHLQARRSTIPFLKRVGLKISQMLFHTPIRFYYNDEVFFQQMCFEHENVFPTIIPNWDHTPRSGRRGKVMVDASPEKFGKTVNKMVQQLATKPYDKRFVFIKSWNEWAEGNYLEPDLKYGHAWLDAIRENIY